MSVRQLSIDVQIAGMVAAQEVKIMLRLGATVREALASAHRAGEEVLSIARRSDDSEAIGGALIRVASRPREAGFLRNHYLLVRHDSAPQVTAISFIGEDEGQALRRFDISRENALAQLAFEELR